MRQYLTKTFKTFLSSFRLGAPFAYSAFFDALYWFLTFLVLVLAKQVMMLHIQRLGLANPQAALLSQQAAEQALIIMRSFFINSALVITGLIILQLLIYTACKGTIWLTLLNKKPTLNYYKGFLLLNIAWYTIWTPVLLIAALGLKPNYVTPVLGILLLLFLHLTTILHYNYTKTGKIRSAFSSLTLKNIHHFITPYILGVLVYLILLQLIRFTPQDTKTLLAISLLILIFWMSWLRTYLVKVIEYTLKDYKQ